jgi:SAM-dependent methyltransferase
MYETIDLKDSKMILSFVCLLLVDVVTGGFLNQPNHHDVVPMKLPRRFTEQRSSPLNAKSICTFDASDFAGSVGDWPYSAADLNRLDNTVDSSFYDVPRFVTHIDDNAIKALTKYYREEFEKLQKGGKDKIDVLDLCSSWISHLPEDISYGRVCGVGMNDEELAANKQLTEHFVQDLNQESRLGKLEDASFDVVCMVVSVDYLIKPKEIFEEIHRILRPGGCALISFSNRCFPTKAIAMWLQADDIGRLTITASYFHYAAKWASIEALDLIDRPEIPKAPSATEIFSNPNLGFAWMNSAIRANQGDPMFVVKGTKE